MANKVAGTVFVKADGQQISLSGSVNAMLFTVEREGLTGPGGPVGFKENNIVPFIEVEAFNTDKTDIEAIHKAEDVTVTVELASGHVGTLRNAWSATAPVIDAVEGKTSLKWEGLDGEWAKGGAAA